MGWIIGLCVSVGFVWLMVTNARFRQIGFWLIGLVALGLGVLWFTSEQDSKRYRERLAYAQSAIAHDQVEIRDLSITDNLRPTLTGTVVNNSPHAISNLTIVVSLQDCPSSENDEGCIVVGQDDSLIYVDVPPGQARRLDGLLDFTDAAQPQGRSRWTYGIGGIEAKLPENID